MPRTPADRRACAAQTPRRCVRRRWAGDEVAPGAQVAVLDEWQPAARLGSCKMVDHSRLQFPQVLRVPVGAQHVVQIQALAKTPPGWFLAEKGLKNISHPQLIEYQVGQVARQKCRLGGRQGRAAGQGGIAGQHLQPGGRRAAQRHSEEMRCLARLAGYRLHIGRGRAEQKRRQVGQQRCLHFF